MDAPGSWLTDAKRTPPQLAPDRVRRAFSALPAPLPAFTALVGGPGAGKTLALAELYAGLARAEAGPRPAVWYALDEEDGDLAGFFGQLVAGLRQHVPVAGEPVLAMLRDGRLAPKPLWQAFFGEVAGYGLPTLALALDDVHHLQALSEVMGALAELAERFPPGYHVLVGTRKPLPPGRQRAGGRARRNAAALWPG